MPESLDNMHFETIWQIKDSPNPAEPEKNSGNLRIITKNHATITSSSQNAMPAPQLFLDWTTNFGDPNSHGTIPRRGPSVGKSLGQFFDKELFLSRNVEGSHKYVHFLHSKDCFEEEHNTNSKMRINNCVQIRIWLSNRQVNSYFFRKLKKWSFELFSTVLPELFHHSQCSDDFVL